MGGALFYEVVGCLHLATVASVYVRKVPQVQAGLKSPNTDTESVQAAPFFAREVTARRVVCQWQHVIESAYKLFLLPFFEEPNFPVEVPVLCGEGLGKPNEGFPGFKALSREDSMDLSVEMCDYSSVAALRTACLVAASLLRW